MGNRPLKQATFAAVDFNGLLKVLVAGGLVYLFLPLGTALQFGGDEGYELMKGFMCSKGYSLYTQIWNDQPPILTLILVGAFKCFGPSLLAARLIAAGFGLLLFGAFYHLVERRAGRWTAILGTFFLVCSPNIAFISVSVMLEVPEMATALLSASLLFYWRGILNQAERNRNPSPRPSGFPSPPRVSFPKGDVCFAQSGPLLKGRGRWLLASGVIMGVALQIIKGSVPANRKIRFDEAGAQAEDRAHGSAASH